MATLINFGGTKLLSSVCRLAGLAGRDHQAPSFAILSIYAAFQMVVLVALRPG